MLRLLGMEFEVGGQKNTKKTEDDAKRWPKRRPTLSPIPPRDAQGQPHSGLDDTRNIARIVSQVCQIN
jgi:hypothetical protein